MRNKFSSNLLQKGLISLAAASVLATGVMATGLGVPIIKTDKDKYNIYQTLFAQLQSRDDNATASPVNSGGQELAVTATSTGTSLSVDKNLERNATTTGSLTEYIYGSIGDLLGDLNGSVSSSITGKGNNLKGITFTTDTTLNSSDGTTIGTNSVLAVTTTDTVTLSYTEVADGDTASETVEIGFSDASFSGTSSKVLVSSSYGLSDGNISIVLTDNDLNMDSNATNYKLIRAYNTSGYYAEFNLSETGDNTGIFKGTLSTGTDLSSTTNYTGLDGENNSSLYVRGTGDTITIHYGTGVSTGVSSSAMDYTMDIMTDSSQNDLTHTVEVSAGTQGTVDLGGSAFSANTPMTISIADTDLNTGSTSLQQISSSSSSVDDYSVGATLYITGTNGTKDTYISLTLTETGLNTGLFTKELSFKAVPDDTISNVVYIDSNLSSPIPVEVGSTFKVVYNDLLDGTTSTSDNNISASATFSANSGTISVSRSTVNNLGLVVLTLNDMDLNKNSEAIEVVYSNDYESNVTVCNSSGTSSYDTTAGQKNCIGNSGDIITFTETGVNTGIFTSGDITALVASNQNESSTGATNDINLTSNNVATVKYFDYVNVSGATASSFTAPTSTASFVGMENVGLISLDASTYTTGSTVTVTLTDEDLNTDSTSVDTYTYLTSKVFINDVQTGNTNAVGVALTETGVDTGVFTGSVTIGSTDVNSTAVVATTSSSTTLTVLYDEDADGNYNTSDTGNRYAQASITNTTATLEIDETSVNTYGDQINITVTDLDQNSDANSADTITVNIRSTTSDTTQLLTLTETDIATGIFTGYLTTNLSTTASTSNTSTASTTLELAVQSGDTIEVTYSDTKNVSNSTVTLSKLATATQTTATIDVPANVETSGTITINVTELDGGYDSNDDLTSTAIARDTLDIKVFSTSDGIGYDMTLVETEATSKIFTGSIEVDSSLSVSGAKIKAVEGDTITIRYDDRTTGSTTSSTEATSSYSNKIDATITVGASTDLTSSSTMEDGTTPITVAVGATYDIEFTGMNDSLEATESNVSIATAEVNAEMLTITGLVEGTTTIDVTDGTDTITVDVTVTAEVATVIDTMADGFDASTAFADLTMDTAENTAASATAIDNAGNVLTSTVDGTTSTFSDADGNELVSITFTDTGYSVQSAIDGISFSRAIVAGDEITVTVNDANGDLVGLVLTAAEAMTTATTPALSVGWNLLGNASNASQTVSKEGIAITWAFDGTWTQDGEVPAGKGFWAKADAEMAGYEFANSGDGTEMPTFTAGEWSLMSATMGGTLSDIFDLVTDATVVWSFKDNTWSNDGTTSIEVGQGFWIK